MRPMQIPKLYESDAVRTGAVQDVFTTTPQAIELNDVWTGDYGLGPALQKMIRPWG